MLRCLSLFALLSFSLTAFAGLKYSEKSPSKAKVLKIRDEIILSPEYSSITTGGGMTACEEKTGTTFFDLTEDETNASLFVNCATVYTSNEADAQTLLAVFPKNKKYKGVYVVVVNVGVVVAQ